MSVTLTKASAEVREGFQAFLTKYKHRLPSDKVVRWHTDNGGEFMSDDLDAFCDEFAIKRSFSIPYSPPTNAHAERMWGILLRIMRITMIHSNMHDKFWTYAMDNALLLHNSLPSVKLPGEISPIEALTGDKPNLEKFRVFGCLTWYYVAPHERRSKLSPRAVPAINLGCDPDRSGYIVYVPSLNRITSAVHLAFQERKFVRFSGDDIIVPRATTSLKGAERLYNEEHIGDGDRRMVDGTLFNPSGEPVPEDVHGDDQEFPDGHCSDSNCTLGKHPEGTPHSYERVGTWKDGFRRDRGSNPDYTDSLSRPASMWKRAKNVVFMDDYNLPSVNVVYEDVTGATVSLATDVNLHDITLPKT